MPPPSDPLLARSPRILIAPDKFKGTLSAFEVGSCLSEGIQAAWPAAITTVMPVADGGDGTLEVAIAAGYTPIDVSAADALGRPVEARIAVQGDKAVIELAAICGLQRCPAGAGHAELCTTKGLGLAMRAALEMGLRQLVIGLGGSASTDGGAGMLVGLGAKLRDSEGHDVEPTPTSLTDVAHIDLYELTAHLDGAELLFAVDVNAPLLGSRGAATVFGPQKGADQAAVGRLEQALRHWAKLLHFAGRAVDPDTPGAGAAGGAGFAGIALGGRLRSGADLCLELAGFDEALASADVVVTGEGRLDEQTLLGKAPLKIATRARAAQIPVIAVVGGRSPDLSDSILSDHGFKRVYALLDEAAGAADDPELSRQCLRTIGLRIAQELRQSSIAR